MKWVTSTTVEPRSRIFLISSHATRRAAGSRPVVISSRKTTSGLLTSANATKRRWRCPPEREAKEALALSLSPQSVINCFQSVEPALSEANRDRASQTWIRSGSADSWSWHPMRCRRVADSVRGLSPRTRNLPSSARRRPWRHSTVVVLPAPLGPSKPKISPRFTLKDTSSTALNAPYFL
jgi:hypothetical protein